MFIAPPVNQPMAKNVAPGANGYYVPYVSRTLASLGGNIKGYMPGPYGTSIADMNNSKAFNFAAGAATVAYGFNRLASYGAAKLASDEAIHATANGTTAAQLAAEVEQAKIAADLAALEIEAAAAAAVVP